MKFLHCADVHLDSPLQGLVRYEGAPVDDIRGATRRAMENLVALAIDEGVTCVVIAGDLYDGDRDDFNTAIFFQKQLHALRDAGIQVVIVQGNHDAANAITKRLSLPDNTHLFSHKAAETKILEDAGLALHGRSYATRAVTDDLAAGYPAPVSGLCNVGVLHTCLDGQRGHDPYAPCSIDQLANHGYRYWALGHVHQREVIERNGVRIVFPGNLQGRHARETGPKGATLVDYDGGRVENVEARVLDVVRWIRVDVDATAVATTAALVDQSLECIEEATAAADDRLCAVRLAITGTSAAHDDISRRREQWESQLRADAAGLTAPTWIEKIDVRVRPAASPLDDAAISEARDAVHSMVAALADDPNALALLLEEVRPLRTKLGADFPAFGELTGIDLSPEGIAELLPDIEAMLVAELQRGDG